VDVGCASNHALILLRLERKDNKPRKFNGSWSDDKEFQNLVTKELLSFDPSLGDSESFRSAKSLKKLKGVTGTRVHD
jgi:hypothetical protein